MDIYVLNQDNERLDIIDTYQSAIWHLKYYDAGEFELYIAADDYMIQLLRKGNRLVRDVDISADGSLHHVMLVQKVNLSTDEEDGDYLIVTGYDLKSIIGQRIIWNQTVLSGTVENGIKKLLNENVISPSDSDRKISNFKLDFKDVCNDVLQQQLTGDNLLTAVTTILTEYNTGWDIYIDSQGYYTMTLYKGKDRSIEQDDIPHVVFSAKNENIIDDTYSIDYTKYTNVVLVAGEGEGTARRRAVSGKAEGLDRYETYKDARDVSSNNGDVSDSEYQNMLQAAGAKLIAESGFVEKYEGSIETGSIYEYVSDYWLGDVVTVINKYGISANPRITEVIESVSDDGVTIVPTLSTWIGD